MQSNIVDVTNAFSIKPSTTHTLAIPRP